ncbi:MAG: helix-turn-helix transcriptional regulator [Bacilli bacterium]|nr:helix-turn-helix transcriptional regulator [Bacilli bacterium]
MSVGQKLLDLRKSKQLSQEEVAEKLNVTRQTISKWETDQSMPDFDKIVPLCKLYEISADELLTGKKSNEIEVTQVENTNENEINYYEKQIKKKKALGMSISIIMYFAAVAWIMVSIPALKLNPIISTAIFILICGIATCIIVYNSMVYQNEKKVKMEEVPKLQKQINTIIATIILIIYLTISFTTGAWYITWLLWIVYGLIEEIVKLLFILRSKENER